MLAQQAHQGGHRGVVLLGVIHVGALGVQVTLLVVPCQDPCQDIGAVSFVVKGRLGGEHEQVRAVLPPADLVLQPGMRRRDHNLQAQTTAHWQLRIRKTPGTWQHLHLAANTTSYTSPAIPASSSLPPPATPQCMGHLHAASLPLVTQVGSLRPDPCPFVPHAPSPSPCTQLSAGWHQSRPRGHPGCRRCAPS